jgi:hypothetical protein
MDKRYPPMPASRRLLMLVLALVTTSTPWFMLIYGPGDPKRACAPQAASQAMCANSPTRGCAGQFTVIRRPAAALGGALTKSLPRGEFPVRQSIKIAR